MVTAPVRSKVLLIHVVYAMCLLVCLGGGVLLQDMKFIQLLTQSSLGKPYSIRTSTICMKEKYDECAGGAHVFHQRGRHILHHQFHLYHHGDCVWQQFQNNRRYKRSRLCWVLYMYMQQNRKIMNSPLNLFMQPAYEHFIDY